ncbi:MAG: PHP domain-containing protein [Methanoregulaceae archaeon]|nr:PHP domain-containing protein [Methanoregulaceae archaeon]
MKGSDDDDVLKFDMHIHTWFSPDSAIDPASVIRLWEKKRILPLVCDHNSIAGSEAVFGGISKISPDIPVILAEEISTSEGEIIGLFLNEEIPCSLSAAETLDRVRDQGGLSLVPHPFCSYRSSAIRRDTLEEVIGRVDIIEGYNARVLSDDENLMARDFAAEHKKPMSVGSDAHTPLELGRCSLQISPFSGPEELIRELREASVRFRLMHPSIHYFTKMVKLARSFRKE